MTENIYIGEWKVDLFEDESVDVVARVLDVSNIKKNAGDYTKEFTVPPTKNNQKLFKHWYNADVDNGFDARTKVDGRIEIDGIVPIFGKGKFRLSKVNVKQGEPSSYTISFFGDLVNLTDILKKDELKDLDLSEYDHVYNAANVKTGLTSSLHSGSIKYTPLVKKQYYYNSVGDNTQNETFANIAAGGGDDTGIVWDDLRPAIKAINIIEAIESKYAGSIQRSILSVQTAPNSSGVAIITLNGTEHNITLSGGGTVSTAMIAVEISDAVNLISGYSSVIILGSFVVIDSDEKERQLDTIFNAGTATGLTVSYSTLFYGVKGTPIRFTRDFFGTSEFSDLYLWLNPDEGLGIGGNTQIIEWDSPNMDYVNPATHIGTYPFDIDTRWNLSAKVTPAVGFADVEYQILSYKNGSLINTTTLGTGTRTGSLGVQSVNSGSFDSYFEVKSTSSFSYTAQLTERETYTYPNPWETTITTAQASFNTIEGEFIISNNMPKLKLIDFLKGIFDMYKLVVVPLDNGDLYVNTLSAYYAQGKTYDITEYAHFDENEVQRGNILNEINFKFEDPTTILNTQFKTNTGEAYGDEETLLYTDESENELLDGDSLDIKVPFEQIIYERLIDENDDVDTNVMYGAIISDTLSPENPKAHLMYIIPKNQVNKSIGFIDEVGGKTTITGNLNVPSHTDSSEFQNYSTVFGRERNEWNGDNIENTLYTNHWQDYILALFNIKKREFQYTANLPLRIVTKLGLNDVLKIKGNYYRIDKYAYNLLTGKTKLNLINSFDNTINSFKSNISIIKKDAEEEVITITITNSEGATNSKTDLGFGTGWANVSTISSLSNIFYLSISENTTAAYRSMRVVFTQPVTGATQTISIDQSANIITSDNNIITSDNNLITSDNG